MIWTKTEAGRIEIQARAVIKERPQRNLLLVIDGVKTEEMLLASMAGISETDFVDLHVLGLITPVLTSGRSAPRSSRFGVLPAPEPATAAAPIDAQFSATLTQMISSELGLRGFVLTLAVEKAATAQDLQAVALRAIEQIRERKGDAAAVTAQRALFGA